MYARRRAEMGESSRTELIGFYFEEVRAYVPEIQDGITRVKAGDADTEVIRELFRLFHNIKGAASQVYLRCLSEVALLTEFVLEQIMDKELAVTPAVTCFLDDSVEKISEYCSREEKDDRVESDLLEARLADFLELCTQQGNVAGIALHKEIAHPLEGNLMDFANTPAQSGDGVSLIEDEDAVNKSAEASSSADLNDMSLDDFAALPGMDNEIIDESFLDELLADSFSQNEIEGSLQEEPGDDSALEIVADAGDEEGDEVLFEIFREECEDHLVVISRTLNNLEERIVTLVEFSPELREDLGAMRRAVHTLKGAAAMVGYSQLATSAHSLEDMLDWLHDHAGHIGPADLQVMASAIDLIEHLSRQPHSDNAVRIGEMEKAIAGHLAERHSATSGETEGSGESSEQEIQPETIATMATASEAHAESDDLEDGAILAEETVLSPSSGNIRVKVENLDEIIRIEGELVVARSSMEGIVNELSLSMDELQAAQEKLRRIAQELESGFEVQSLYGFGTETLPEQTRSGRGSTGFNEFDPIELDRYSKLNLIIRSLNELSVDVNSIHAGMTGLSSELQGHIARQQLVMGAMQDKLMRTRMTPMSAVSRAFFRTVRNTAAQLGKNVRLTVTGDDVFMDRFIWSKITDPLMHILRNCVDHGIEVPTVRLEKGKPETASIRIEARQLGSFVELFVSDDGAGIDTGVLRRKLAAAKLVSNPETLSDEDLLPYLFQTGFSTKDEVSQVSGRGVGLDVVLKNIQELRGTVRIKTQAGQGTRFELRIPITLSINKAILVSAADRQYAIPLQDVVEVRRVAFSELTGEDARFNWRQEDLAIKDLAVMLQLRQSAAIMAAKSGSCLVLIVQGSKGYEAIMIDEIKGQMEIVVKDLGTYLTHVKGVSGVTILGDGNLIPVLNFSELGDVSRTLHKEEKLPSPSQVQELPLQVLIVDDSISVRQSIARLVKHQSWRPEMAVDGVNALEKLETFRPDAIILDIEMPRMNGYEFMSILRKNEKYHSIPVIMLTSRTSDKHRAKADELGVDFYLTKPFQDDTFVQLLSGIRQYRRSR